MAGVLERQRITEMAEQVISVLCEQWRARASIWSTFRLFELLISCIDKAGLAGQKMSRLAKALAVEACGCHGDVNLV